MDPQQPTFLHDTPLRDRHARFAALEAERTPLVDASERPGAATGRRAAFEIDYLPYAVPGGAPGEPERPICAFVASYGPIEPEYAAIRRGAALFDAAQRGVVRVRGTERLAFLQRMITQDVASLAPGRTTRGFLLNRKGRIDADLLVAELPAGGELPAEALLLVDASAAAATAQELAKYVFSEDVAFEDATREVHQLELHGPNAGRALALAGAKAIPVENEATRTSIGGRPVVLVRSDLLGERGWTIVAAQHDAPAIWDALLDAVDPHDAADPQAHRRRVRPIGWHAYNIARIEAGTPFFHIDYGPTNLPHETGILHQRVHFKKGCYLGQEVVARMESLGKPKQMLGLLRPTRDLLPVAGSQVFERTTDGGLGPQIGGVTSSTLSPMLGAAPIAFAMAKTAFVEGRSTVLVNAEGEQCEARVSPLRSALAADGHEEGTS